MALEHAAVRITSTSLSLVYLNDSPSYRRPTLTSNPLLFLELLTMPFNATLRNTINSVLRLRKTEMAYAAIQSTKPQTIGYSLNDSPVGLLAWIYEKLVKGSDKYPWTDDEGNDLFPLRQCLPSS